MSWYLAIDRNRQALVAIAAGLVGLVLCGFSAKPSGLPSVRAQASRLNASSGAATEGGHISHNRRYVSRVLRAAEAALRRLIVIYMKAHNITAHAPKPRIRPLPDFTQFRRNTDRVPAFNLFDPRKTLVMLDGISSLSASTSVLLTAHAQASRLIASTGVATEGVCHDNIDCSSLAGEPRIWIMGNSDWHSLPYAAEQALRVSAAQVVSRWSTDKPYATSRDGREPDGEAEKQLRRIHALNHALKTIPPGHRACGKEDIDHVLSECHGLMRDMEMPPI